MKTTKSFYMSMWRWHFYAGLYSVPFLIMLAITGLIMLYSPFIERWQNQDLYYVESNASTSISFEDQKLLVQSAYPDSWVKRFYLPKDTNEATRFQVIKDGEALSVFVDPYKGKVLGDLSITHSLYAWADETHGTFMMGLTGDWMIEIAVSFTILLIISGIYLWWPTGKNTLLNGLKIQSKKGRGFWKELHSVTGVWIALLLVFFCISGLAWTDVWGKKLTQSWSSFPMEKSASSVSSTLTHTDLNVKGVKQIPWGLEQSKLPVSEPQDGTTLPTQISLDQVIQKAKDLNFTQFQVHFPQGETGVYTATASSMGKDIKDGTKDRTVHFDQYSGKVLADVGYADYSWFAKSMAVGISLHMGQWGWWNLAICTAFCLGVILLCVTGAIMWWKRRPRQSTRLHAPTKPKDLSRWKHAVWLLMPVALLFPLAAIAMFSVVLLDQLLTRLIPPLKTVYQ
ncbi:PepSY domain-containing protein [Marinomonas mediterranea]|uniref:PepSY-associated TM helix domain-containing protein n=1 Tax=Marinomonas mediterranea TaxID=119864 RepID=UPI00234979C6|nr:PepSY domain-containing protein [Marinomonas mediterranea]WCN12491.1 PepSY domain-containing protein [Marinomonas mediterranea]